MGPGLGSIRSQSRVWGSSRGNRQDRAIQNSPKPHPCFGPLPRLHCSIGLRREKMLHHGCESCWLKWICTGECYRSLTESTVGQRALKVSLLLCVETRDLIELYFPQTKSPYIYLCSHSFLLGTVSRDRPNDAVFWTGYITCVVRVYVYIGERGEGHINHICNKWTNNVTDISWEGQGEDTWLWNVIGPGSLE